MTRMQRKVSVGKIFPSQKTSFAMSTPFFLRWRLDRCKIRKKKIIPTITTMTTNNDDNTNYTKAHTLEHPSYNTSL